jgi:hypothetical protein
VFGSKGETKMFVILMKQRHGEITHETPITQGGPKRYRRTIKGVQKEGWCFAKAQASKFKSYF